MSKIYLHNLFSLSSLLKYEIIDQVKWTNWEVIIVLFTIQFLKLLLNTLLLPMDCTNFTYKFSISGRELALSTILLRAIKIISKTRTSYRNYTREHCSLEISICMTEACLSQKSMTALADVFFKNNKAILYLSRPLIPEDNIISFK